MRLQQNVYSFVIERKQENDITLNKKYGIAQLIAYIPAVVIGGYLIIPFLFECYNQLNVYREMMSSWM